MNNIILKQNESKFIIYLKAQRVIYSKVKLYLSIKWIIIVLGLLSPFIKFITNNYEVVLGVIAALCILIYYLIENILKKKSLIGAKIQEQFDTELYGLDWNSKLCNTKVDIGIILELSKNYKKCDLKNWYSLEIKESLPFNIQILLCQRINVSWNIDLNKKYILFSISTIIVYYSILFISFIYNNYLFIDSLLYILYTIPYLIETLKSVNIYQSQNDIQTKDLHIINDMIDKYQKHSKEPSKISLRKLQDSIFIRRNTISKIPDWFYNMFKKNSEDSTDKIIKTIIG